MALNNRERTENFLKIRDKLEGEGFHSSRHIISVVKANVMALVTAVPLAVLGWILFFAVHPNWELDFYLADTLLFLIIMIAGIFIHEFLHGLIWSFGCKNGWKSIHLGVMWKKLTPYCCCMEPLGFGTYILGGLMPLLVLGFGIYITAIATGSIFWLTVSAVNIVGTGGDVTIALMLLRHRDALIFDDPTECGFWAFRNRQNNL